METTVREKGSALKKYIQGQYSTTNFFQYVRMLEGLNSYGSKHGDEDVAYPVGYAWPLNCEVVNFTTHLSYQFPKSSISNVSWPSADAINKRPKIEVTFMGLDGVSGCLPDVYTKLVIKQNQLNNFPLGRFFNTFNHRLVSLYYRAWEKNQFYVDFERKRRLDKRDDMLTEILDCLSGFGHPSLKNKLPINQDSLLHFVGTFSQQPHNAINLSRMLSNFFGIDIKMEQFIGSWAKLTDSQRTRLPGKSCPKGQYNLLSINAVLGTKTWSSQGHFRLIAGPLSKEKFDNLLPVGTDIKGFVEMVRSFIGPELTFELQLELVEKDIPSCKLSRLGPPRLSWNTWLASDNNRNGSAVVLNSSITDL